MAITKFKQGDYIYFASRFGKVKRWKIKSVGYDGKLWLHDGTYFEPDCDRIFATKEEAEAKLKELQNNK